MLSVSYTSDKDGFETFALLRSVVTTNIFKAFLEYDPREMVEVICKTVMSIPRLEYEW